MADFPSFAFLVAPILLPLDSQPPFFSLPIIPLFTSIHFLSSFLFLSPSLCHEEAHIQQGVGENTGIAP